jgi:hypothetical protein
MSYTRKQLWDLLGQVYHMPYGSAQIALVEQVVAHADAAHLTELAFAAGCRQRRPMCTVASRPGRS